MCGGLGYINIFHTDALKTTIDDWGCGATLQDTYYQKWYEDMGHCNISTTGAATTAASLAPATTAAPALGAASRPGTNNQETSIGRHD